jgi:hypothetical protein
MTARINVEVLIIAQVAIKAVHGYEPEQEFEGPRCKSVPRDVTDALKSHQPIRHAL